MFHSWFFSLSIGEPDGPFESSALFRPGWRGLLETRKRVDGRAEVHERARDVALLVRAMLDEEAAAHAGEIKVEPLPRAPSVRVRRSKMVRASRSQVAWVAPALTSWVSNALDPKARSTVAMVSSAASSSSVWRAGGLSG